MPRRPIVYDILVAGPSDVELERQAVEQEIEIWNRVHAAEMGLGLTPLTWESGSRPEIGVDAQSILNRQVADRSDAIIAIFGIRLGTPTPRAASGTVEEIERLVKARKPVMVYFGAADLPRNFDRAQLDALNSFKDLIQGRGLTADYASVEDLRAKVSRHIMKLAYDFQRDRFANPIIQLGALIGDIETDTDYLVLHAIAQTALETDNAFVTRAQIDSTGIVREKASSEVDVSLSVLRRRGLIEALPEARNPEGTVKLNDHGLEVALRKFDPDYDSKVRAVLSSIVREGVGSAEEVSAQLGLSYLFVNHVLEQLRSQGLLRISRLTDLTRIDGYEAELLRALEELERRESSAIGTVVQGSTPVREKACLSLINRGSISTSGGRVEVAFLIRNEGDAPARDVSVRIENEEGQSHIGGGKVDVLAPEGDREFKIPFSQSRVDDRELEPVRRFRIVAQFRDRHGWDEARFTLMIRRTGGKWRREIDPAETVLSPACRYIQPELR